MTLLTAFYWLISLSVVLRILSRRRSVSNTLAWLLIIAALPVVGIFAYVLMGELTLGKRREAMARAMASHYLFMDPREKPVVRADHEDPPRPRTPVAFALQRMLEQRTGLGTLPYHSLKLLDTPRAIFDHLLADIDRAQENVRMEFYIWHPGRRVTDIAEALIRAHRRGVRVELLIDHAGSRQFFRSQDCRNMRDAGLKVVPALPVRIWRFMFRRLDLRQHRKLIVIDHQIAYTGSMNMADPEVFNTGSGAGPWVDIMVRLEGEVAQGLSRVFSWDWEMETGQRDLPQWYMDPRPAQGSLTILPSGPGTGDDLIEQAVLSSIYRADHRIRICTPYFVPSEELFEALCHAAKRQVEVELILPERNNSWLVHWASTSYFDTLLQLGVSIYRFQGGLLHAKALLVDDELALLGSVNLDVRSLQLNFELSVALFNEHATATLKTLLDRYVAESRRMDPEVWARRPLRYRLLERTLFFLSPLL